MFNKLEFNAQIVRKGLRKTDVAKALNIDISTLYRKIENDGDFDRDQINTLIGLLGIEDPTPIFFADELT
jgi:predicted transcriptional regulator